VLDSTIMEVSNEGLALIYEKMEKS
jgi:hypothetical protein